PVVTNFLSTWAVYEEANQPLPGIAVEIGAGMVMFLPDVFSSSASVMLSMPVYAALSAWLLTPFMPANRTSLMSASVMLPIRIAITAVMMMTVISATPRFAEVDRCLLVISETPSKKRRTTCS